MFACLQVNTHYVFQNLTKEEFSLNFCKVLNYQFFLIRLMGAELPMCTDGRTDSHHETKTRFSEMCVVSDIVHSVIYYVEQSPS